MFESPFNKQNNSIFNSPFQPSNSEERLEQLYKEIENMKFKQQNPQNSKRTVFTDIQDEMKSVSEDEKNFIENSKEYLEASQKYQADFSMFLMEYLGNDFLSSKYGKSPEEILFVIRNKKEEYKNKFAANINEIRDQNNVLSQKNDELAEMNLKLQEQLAAIQKEIGGLKYDR